MCIRDRIPVIPAPVLLSRRLIAALVAGFILRTLHLALLRGLRLLLPLLIRRWLAVLRFSSLLDRRLLLRLMPFPLLVRRWLAVLRLASLLAVLRLSSLLRHRTRAMLVDLRLLKMLLRYSFMRLIAVMLGADLVLPVFRVRIACSRILSLVGRQRCSTRCRMAVPMVPSMAAVFPVATPVIAPARRRIGTPAMKIRRRLAVVTNRHAEHE